MYPCDSSAVCSARRMVGSSSTSRIFASRANALLLRARQRRRRTSRRRRASSRRRAFRRARPRSRARSRGRAPTRAAHAGPRPLVRLEDPRRARAPGRRAVVDDADRDRIAVRARLDPHRAVGGVARGVLEQVDEHLAQQRLVGVEHAAPSGRSSSSRAGDVARPRRPHRRRDRRAAPAGDRAGGCRSRFATGRAGSSTRCESRSTSCSMSASSSAAPRGRDVVAAALAAVALIAVSGVRRSCDTDCRSTVRSRSVSSSVRRRTRSSASRARVSASATTPANDSRNRSRSRPRSGRPGSATTNPNAVSTVRIGNAAGCPARAARAAVRRPLAVDRAARARPAPPGPHRRPGRRAGRAPAIGDQADAPQPERVAELNERAAQRHAASAFWISSTVSACSSVASAARRLGQRARLAQPRDHDAADDRDREVDHERGDARGRLDRAASGTAA